MVAVEGKQGRAWRQAWNDRYLSSPVFRDFLVRMERIEAVTGIFCVATIRGVVFARDTHHILTMP